MIKKAPKNSFLCSFLDTKVEQILFKSIESNFSLKIWVIDALFKRVCVIVDQQHVFIRFVTENDLSAVAVVTGTVRYRCNNRLY